MTKITYRFTTRLPRLIGILTIILFVFDGSAVMSQSMPADVTPWDGQAVFREKKCINCHPVNGVGGRGGPDLRKDIYYGTYLELASLMWNHYPKMSKRMSKLGTEYPALTEEEMSQLIIYLTYQRYLSEPGSEFTGRKLLESKKCFSCHKFGGKGGDIGPDISQNNSHLSPLLLVETMWNHGPDMIDIFEEYQIERPKFYGTDITNLAAGIRSFMPPATSVPVDLYDLGDPVSGKTLVVEKGCLLCHSVRGEGNDLAADFAEITLDYSVTQIAGSMWNHGPEMWKIMKSEGINIPKFEKGEMADVIAFLYFLNFEDKPGNPKTGYEILQKNKCFTCHTLEDEKDKVRLVKAGDHIQDSPMAMIAAMWNHAPAMEKKIKELPWNDRIGWPKLNPEDMTHLYAYFKSLPHPATNIPKSETKKRR